MVIALVAWVVLAAAQPSTLEVEVVDALGGAIRGATVDVQAPDLAESCTSDENGRVVLPVRPGDAVVVSVRAPGFSVARRTYEPAAAGARLRIVLDAAPIDTTITVTATKSEAVTAGVAPSTSVLASAELASAPGFTLDDALRHTPGFSLFRRSSSRVANPTTHGVTLRGLSASGASRTLVLAEGIPLNDPFGGWVSWNRMPLSAIDRVEVVRGGQSDLYGPDALGGVIQLFAFNPARPRVRFYADAAGQETGRISMAGGTNHGGVQLLAAAEGATSEGYVTVGEESRGSIDEPAGGTHGAALFRIGLARGGWLVHGGGHVLAEERQNGTPFQENATAARLGHAEVTTDAFGGLWRLKGFYGTQGYDQTFSAVAADRASETPSQTQYVPSETYGFSTDWATGSRVRAVAGVDERLVRSVNEETRFVSGRPVGVVEAGGRQLFLGAFTQAAFDPAPNVTLLAGARLDHWSVDSYQGDAIEDETLFAPRAAVAWRAQPALTVHGSVSRSFRAPTLNERFRGFRAGDTQTRPNAGLLPERLFSFESGAAFTAGPAILRGTLFTNRMDDAIANVTVSTTPALTTRDRQNAGEISATGVELEGSVRVMDRLHASLGASFTRSRFGEGAPPGLEGNRTPQSPSRQLAAELRWDNLPAIALSLRVLHIGPQYEDDRNTLVLRQATIADVMASRSFGRKVLGLVAVDNVFDTDYDVGRTPLRTVGLPRLLRAGLRVTVP